MTEERPIVNVLNWHHPEARWFLETEKYLEYYINMNVDKKYWSHLYYLHDEEKFKKRIIPIYVDSPSCTYSSAIMDVFNLPEEEFELISLYHVPEGKPLLFQSSFIPHYDETCRFDRQTARVRVNYDWGLER